MRINTNVSAMTTFRNLSNTESAVGKSMQKLSSGFRINNASDDAAGLGIANKMRGDIRAMRQASRNAEQANSMLQVAEGATGSIQRMVERMKELATQSNSDSADTEARSRIDAEFQALLGEITRTVVTTKVQGRTLLDGGFGGAVTGGTYTAATTVGIHNVTLNGARAATYTIDNSTGDLGAVTISATIDGNVVSETVTAVAGKQTLNFAKLGLKIDTSSNFTIDSGAGGSSNTRTIVVGATATADFMVSSSGSGADDKISLNAIDLTVGATGLNLNGLDLTSAANANTALGRLDTALGTINAKLGVIGAAQNRVGYALDNVKTAIQNLAASESVIRDVDMAEEMTTFSKNQILQQAGTAMLAQANQAGQGVLTLLRG